MKVARAHAHGGPEVIRIDALPTPKPAPGEALVRVEAGGVNFMDIYQRTGLYKAPLPLALGREGAGVIEALGDGARDFKPGDRVAWAGAQGSYATHVVAKVDLLVPIPAAVDSKTAAAAMLQGMTAQYLATSTYPLSSIDTCLVHAAAGGVGLLLCQLAKRAGARVLGTVSNEEKAKLAKEHGCDEPIVYTKVDFSAEVRRLTHGKGVHVVFDSVGKSTWDGSIQSLHRRGMMVSYGNASGPVPPIEPLVLSQHGSLYLTRPTLGDYIATREELLLRAGDVLNAIETGTLKIRIHAELPLEKAAEAHRLLESRKTSGKLLLIPGEE